MNVNMIKVVVRLWLAWRLERMTFKAQGLWWYLAYEIPYRLPRVGWFFMLPYPSLYPAKCFICGNTHGCDGSWLQPGSVSCRNCGIDFYDDIGGPLTRRSAWAARYRYWIGALRS